MVGRILWPPWLCLVCTYRDVGGGGEAQQAPRIGAGNVHTVITVSYANPHYGVNVNHLQLILSAAARVPEQAGEINRSRWTPKQRPPNSHGIPAAPSRLVTICHETLFFYQGGISVANTLKPELIDKCVGSRIWVIMKGDKGE